MVDAFVGPLVGKLQEVALSEAKALVKVNDDIRRLRDKLMWLQAFLREADPSNRLVVNELTRVLVRQTRDVAFDAEDAIDQYHLLVEPFRSRRGWARFLFFDSNFAARFVAQFTVRHQLSRKIAVMNERLEDIISNNDKYRNDAAVAASAGTSSKWTATTTTAAGRPSWNSKPSDLIGRNTEQKVLKNLLLQQHNGGQDKDVVCVVGKSGVGKTSLVKKAYEGPGIRSHFAIHIWTSFPPDTSDWIVLPEIYRKFIEKCSALDDLNHETKQQQDQEELNRDKNHSGDNVADLPALYQDWKIQIEKKLNNKRYLLVIDCRQITITKWQRIKGSLPKGAEGSKILLITETQTMDEYTDKVRTIRLEPLNSADTMKLFTSKLPGIIDNNNQVKEGSENGPTLKDKLPGAIENNNQVKEGRSENGPTQLEDKIYGITGGLPLAVLLLAQLLYGMEKEQRDLVFDHISQSNKQAKRLERILSLCFNDLSHDLKSCILYLAGFPDSKLISAQQLVRLWMAEGLLTPKDGKKMEKIGHRYLKELISRGLVQLVSMDVRGNVEYIAIHEHIHAFLRLEARETSFLEVHYGYYVPAAATVRRLSLQNYKNKLSALKNSRLPKLRSVMSYFEGDHEQGRMPPRRAPKEESEELNMHQMLKDSPFLRVINLEGLDVGSKLPEKIGDMVHLRYIGVRSRKLKKVPRSIGNLYNLQTFDVRGTNIRSLPDAFWRIGTLRHVLGTELRFPEPKSAGDLKHLETLESASLEDDNGWDGTIMKKMFNLRVLHVVGLKERHRNALKVALNELNYLLDLTLSGEAVGIDITSHRKDKLVTMKLQGKLDIIEANEGSSTLSRGTQISLSNLSNLELKSTHVKQDFIDKLALLENLTSLSLLKESFEGKELVFPREGFKNLKFLRVSHLDRPEDKKKIVVMSEMMKLETFELIEFNGRVEAQYQSTLDQKINKTFYSKELVQYTGPSL